MEKESLCIQSHYSFSIKEKKEKDAVVFVFVIGITCWSIFFYFFSPFCLIIISQAMRKYIAGRIC